MKYQLNSVAMHITNECSHSCPMCYITEENQQIEEGKLETLKRMSYELKKAGVKEINLVGGDPAEYPQIKELLEYQSKLGFEIPILSNTHNYKNSSIEEITPFVSSLEGTFHGKSAEIHNQFCNKENAYENLINNLKIYQSIKKQDQQLGAVMNVMDHNYDMLFQNTEALLEKGLNIDYVLIQRIGSYGRASNSTKYNMEQQKLITSLKDMARINKELGIETMMVDAYPYCIIPEEYHQYLSKCDWGYGTAAVDMHGNLSRCAVNNKPFLGNILTTSVTDIWEHSPILHQFRNKQYLRDDCQQCDTLEVCGGGCAVSDGSSKLSNDILVKAKIR